MKKYLLFIISMLCVSIGTWAQDPATSGTFGSNGSTWSLDGGVLTLTFNNANDIPLGPDQWDNPNSSALCDLTGVQKVIVNTESGVTLSGTAGWGSALHNLNSYYKSVPVLDLSNATISYDNLAGGIKAIHMSANDGTFNNVILPSSFASNITSFRIAGLWGNDEININKYVNANATTVYAALDKTEGLTALTNITSGATTLKIMNEVGAINLLSVLVSGNILDLTAITTGDNGSNTINVATDVTVVCLTESVKNRVSGDGSNVTVVDPVVSCTASQLSDKLTELSNNGITPTSITITGGTLTEEQMEDFGNLEGLTYLSLQDANDANIGSLALPSTLEALVLPKKASDTKSSVTDAMKAHANLNYIYAPYNGTQDESQIVADYVWVGKSGGLSKAFDNEAGLRNAWYMIVESTVALNNVDVNFWGSDPGQAREMQYRYLDLSGANITPAVAANYKVTDQLPYRVILPDDWTGDQMAVFASNPYKGSIAAVYSYTGTDHKRLDILELNDYAYLSTALNDSRIVRSGTTSIRVVSGHYGDNPVYSKFGDNLLTAINGAASSITSVTIAVGSGVCKSVDTDTDADDEDDEDQAINTDTEFAFTNTYLTELIMNNVSNSNLTIDVTGCTNLTTLYLNETTLAGVNASGVSGLTTASLGHAIVGGDVNLSGTSLTTLLEVDRSEISGTLNISSTAGTSYDLSKVTAVKVDASENNSMTSLNINGISLNNDSWTSGDSNEDGKVKVTRTSGDYNNLTITTADGFNSERIIPSGDIANKYTIASIAEARVEIKAIGNSLSTTVPAAVEAYNAAQDPVESNTVANVQVLHVTGTLTDADIAYIKSDLTALELLDLTGCEYSGDLAAKIVETAIPQTTAIILPGKTNTEADMIVSVKALQDANYECVGYYTAYDRDGSGNSSLNVYGYNETVGKLASAEPRIIDGNTKVTFLRRYYDTDVEATTHAYPKATPNFLTSLCTVLAKDDMGCASVDLSWLDISDLGIDFSELNTQHVIIPQNTTAATTTLNGIIYNNDFTKVDDGTESSTYKSTDTYKYYKFHYNTNAVSTYKATAAPYATNAYFNGRAMSFDNGYGGLNTTATLVYALKPNGLSYINDYMSDKQKAASVVMIAGELDGNSLYSGLNRLTNPQIDLTRATLVTTGEDPFTWSDYSNSSVQYLALPDGQNDVIAATSADDFAFATNLTALKAVGAYDPANLKYTVHSTANTVTWTDEAKTTFSAQENSVYVITKLCAPNSTRQAGSALGTTEVEMSGYLTLSDIQMNGSDAEAGLNTNSSGSVVTADFSNAVFMNNNDMCFTAATWNGKALTSILLPTDERQNTIPARSLYNYSALTEICIPYNYEYIGNAAFYLANLGHLTTTDKNGALVDNGDHTFTFSKNLKAIGEKPDPETTDGYPTAMAEPVFFSYAYHSLTDVYVLRTGYEDGEPFNPTKCYRNAFGAGPTYGWGGFDGGNVYCREKFVNGDQLFTVLHFPDKASVSNDEDKYNNVKKTYTDPTKIYTKKDQTGAVDANGDSPLWPTFSELGRSYNQAVRGLIWNDWNYELDGQKEVNGGTLTATPGAVAGVTDTKESNEDRTGALADYNFTDYVGWHEFVLSLATYVAPDENVDEDNKVYRQYELDDYWYTFCIPFDMTEAEVVQLLGVPVSTDQIVTTLDDLTYDSDGKVTDAESIGKVTTALLPEVRTIKSVTRNASTNTVKISTTLDLASGEKKNKYYNPSTKNYDNNGSIVINEVSTPVMLRAGYPYYIRPYKIKGTTIAGNNLGKQVMTRYAFSQVASAINHDDCWDLFSTSKFARPYEGHKIQAIAEAEEPTELNHTDEAHKDQPYNYTFIGQFWKQELPDYCFYMSSHKWYHYTNHQNGWYWNPYICIIMVTDESKEESAKGGKFRDEDSCTYPKLIGTDAKGHDVFDNGLAIKYKDGLNDVFTTASARDYQFFFDDDIMDFDPDGNTTAIEVLDGVRVAPVRGKVYNMAGQYVGNSLEGLSKGMYIVNGKKYVIK